MSSTRSRTDGVRRSLGADQHEHIIETEEVGSIKTVDVKKNDLRFMFC